jgi:predicted enzyme related to lactoylglutathione lyase
MPEEPSVVLSTVIIQTSRIKELASFYDQGLNLGEALSTGDDHLGFKLSNLYFGFDQVEGGPKPTETVSVWFEVGDIQRSFARFTTLGARVKYKPSRKPWGGFLAALYDPDGNLFGLSQVE